LCNKRAHLTPQAFPGRRHAAEILDPARLSAYSHHPGHQFADIVEQGIQYLDRKANCGHLSDAGRRHRKTGGNDRRFVTGDRGAFCLFRRLLIRRWLRKDGAQPVNRRLDKGVVRRVMGNRPIHQNADHVQRGVHRVAQCWRHAQATLSQRGKQILDGVRNLLDARQTGRAGAAFQAVRSAKKLVNERAIIGVIGMLLHFEQQ
jgi:hypothetical protein